MPGMELSDSQLAVMAGEGDAEAYRRLFERYQHPIYNFVYRLVDNAEDASDIVQDAFIKMYSVLGATEVQNFSAYLYRTAKNLAYDEMRRRTRFADVDHEVLAPEDPNIYADPQRALLLGEQMETVRRAAGGLNENQRAALILRELEELDYDQMSDVLESNRNAVGALLSRARLKFREELRMAQITTDQCPPECEEIIAKLSPYIDGELGGDEKARVESHLEGCTFCLAALEEMREASRSFRMFIPVIPPADVAQAFSGRLAELAGQGSAGGSWLTSFRRSKALWLVVAGAAILLLATAGMLAWGAGGSQAPAPLTSEISGTNTTTGAQSQTNAGSRATPAAVETQEQTDTAPTTSTSTSSDTGTGTQTTPRNGGRDYTPAQVKSGYASPSAVNERQTVSFVSVIKGAATSVTVELAPQSGGPNINVGLTRTSTGGGTETWSASSVAGARGIYYIYISAIDSQGQYDSLYVGNLTVNATIY